ncbi:unnamed protein product [Rhizoctonia solani]|uniref:DUF6533 domain-containing protein n=1 Tax=Rhizoctonia solani TaxID=456999 RepID=A0A8H3AW46_9AGAM|nr:unnamed protein product [Rhizoctonia solani]
MLDLMRFNTQQELVDFLDNNQRTRYASLASFVFLVYDYLVTVFPEVELVWVRSPGFPRSIDVLTTGIHSINHGLGQKYFLSGIDTGHLSFCCLILSSFWVEDQPMHCNCLHWQRFQGWTGWLTNMTVEIIILVRIAAMYSQDRRIIYPVLVLFFAQAVGMAAIIGISFADMKAQHERVPGFHICSPVGIPGRM